MYREFSRKLIRWYELNKRDLPWRHTRDPYKIWLSEVILQQTQVAQGLAYYNSFITRFPDVNSLARAHEDDILKTWQGLGYYSRARNLHSAAKTISEEHLGIFPRNYEGILSLKGVGRYTAAAIASFAFDLPHAVVDGNVYRVLSRVFGIRSAIDSVAGQKEFAALAQELLDQKRAALHNQAIMEFGALYCRTNTPDCVNCIFTSTCAANAGKMVADLPVKIKRTKVRERHLNYVVLADRGGRVRVNKRSGSDIWKGLYEFNLVESGTRSCAGELPDFNEVREACDSSYALKHVSGDYVHQLSHQKLFAKFYVFQSSENFIDIAGTVSVEELHKIAFPRLIGKFLEDCDLKEMF